MRSAKASLGLAIRCHAIRRLSTIASAATISDLLPSLHRLKLAEDRFALPASTPMSQAAQHLLDERLTFALVIDDVAASDVQQNHATNVSADVVGILCAAGDRARDSAPPSLT